MFVTSPTVTSNHYGPSELPLCMYFSLQQGLACSQLSSQSHDWLTNLITGIVIVGLFISYAPQVWPPLASDEIITIPLPCPAALQNYSIQNIRGSKSFVSVAGEHIVCCGYVEYVSSLVCHFTIYW